MKLAYVPSSYENQNAIYSHSSLKQWVLCQCHIKWEVLTGRYFSYTTCVVDLCGSASD